MIVDELITLQTKTRTKNSEGMNQDSWSDSTTTFYANVQPKSLSEDESKSFGLSSISSDAKVMYYYKNSSVTVGVRVKRADGSVYDVRGINPWRIHDEAVLIPIQGV